MKNLFWFMVGIAGGFVAAHVLNKNPRGHELLAEVDARINEFTERIGDAYREQEARFDNADADSDSDSDSDSSADTDTHDEHETDAQDETAQNGTTREDG